MKILHTADWHVGKTLHYRQRLDDAKAVLDQIVALAIEEQVDLLLNCGDVFDSSSPSPAAEQIVFDALLALERAGIPVVLLAGNHDSAARWRALKPLLDRFSVQVVSEARPPGQGGVIEVPSCDGSESAQIAVLPWIAEKRMYDTTQLMGNPGETVQAYADGMRRVLASLCSAFTPGHCHILAGHLFVDGAAPSGSERPLTMGEVYAVTSAALPSSPQYVALGHVHRAQDMHRAPVPTRYCGSPWPLDFGEAKEEKGVTLVELSPGLPAQVRPVPILAGRQLRELSATMEELREAAAADAFGDDFLKITVRCEGPQLGLGDQVRELLPNAITVRLDYPRLEQEQGERVPDLAELRPQELFEGYYRQHHGAEPKAELLTLFQQLLDEEEQDDGDEESEGLSAAALGPSAVLGPPMTPGGSSEAVSES